MGTLDVAPLGADARIWLRGTSSKIIPSSMITASTHIEMDLRFIIIGHKIEDMI